jgi:hypothetical protein
VIAPRPASTHDLLDSERRFVQAMQDLGFGRFEFLQIRNGELVLDPWPTTVRDVKFGSQEPTPLRLRSAEFELKRQVVELFEYVRSVEAGEIRALEVRHGLPFSMEIETAPGGRRA